MDERRALMWGRSCLKQTMCHLYNPAKAALTVVWLLGRSQPPERSPFCLHPLDQGIGSGGGTSPRGCWCTEMLGHPESLCRVSLLCPAAPRQPPRELLVRSGPFPLKILSPWLSPEHSVISLHLGLNRIPNFGVNKTWVQILAL